MLSLLLFIGLTTSGEQEKYIRTSSRTINQLAQDKLQAQSDQYKRLSKRIFKQYKKRIVRYSVLAANAALLVLVLVVVHSPDTGQSIAKSAVSASSSDTVNAVDQLSSADIAVNVAKMTNLAESTSVANNADSVNIRLALANSSETVIGKPQVISTDIKSRSDIQTYVVQSGDTISSLASKFNVTSDTLRWSNAISGDSLEPGSVLRVLPGVNGIIYLVRGGDTPESLASRFQVSKDIIIAYNDAEVGGLPVGGYIIIPGGTPAIVGTPASSNTVAGFTPSYGYNGYDYGWCTWYVASKISVPTNWGNANTWSVYAPSSGWSVSQAPRAGGIGQTTGGWAGHVAYIEAVSPDGSMVKFSDMNGLAGWGRVGRSDWVPASHFDNYIYR